MKNLSLVSFVGVDADTNLEDLKKFKNSIPTEFGVLYSDSKSLTNHKRYPSLQFCKDFLQWSKSNTENLASLHLCGDVIGRYLAQEADVLDLCKNANRIQLNLSISSFPSYEKLTNDLISVMTTHGHNIVLQENKTKRNFNLAFLKTISSSLRGQISLLHDGSGGFGREITQVESPSGLHYTGYAGGIKPENVAKIVDLIEKNNPNGLKYYIDMESGVRTDNTFSLEKCQQVINNLTQ